MPLISSKNWSSPIQKYGAIDNEYLWKESLNKQWLSTIPSISTITSHHNSLTTHKAYDVGNRGPGLGQVQKYGGVKPIMVSQPSPLDTGISNSNIYINNTYINNTYINNTYINNTYLNNTYINNTYINNIYINNTYINNTYINNTYINNTYINNTYINNTYLNNTYINNIYINNTYINNTYINNTYLNNTYINKLENITYYRKQWKTT